MFRQLAQSGAEGDTIMMDSTYLKAHRTAASLPKGGHGGAIGRTKGGLNSKLQMVCNGRGRPLTFGLAPGPMSDARGPRSYFWASCRWPSACLSDRGYDADWLRDELKVGGLRICITARRGRCRPASHSKRLYKNRCRTENAFARLKDWRGIATRYTRCADLFLSAICLAATVPFCLSK